MNNRRAKNKKKRKDGELDLVQHPLSGIDPVLLRSALVATADKKVEEFPKLLDSILSLFREKNPRQIIGILAGYGLMAGVSDEGVEKRLVSKLEQHHIELLQALALTIPLDEWGVAPALPDHIQLAIDAVTALTDAFHIRRFNQMDATNDPQAMMVSRLQERIRLHTQVLRNWGYFSQVVKLANELYSPLDERFKREIGFTASELITTGYRLTKILEARINERFSNLQRVFREKNIGRLVRAYYKYFPSIQGDPEEFIAAIPFWATLDSVKARLISHADLDFLNIMDFKIAEIASATNLPSQTIEAILNQLSLTAGCLREENPEHMFMTNPVWCSPIVRLTDSYFCPAPQSIFSHINDILSALADKAGLSEALESHRSNFLETKVSELLSTALPSAELRNGIKWRLGETQYETDHVALIDRIAVIVEDKSARLTPSGLRGAPDRARRHVKDLIVDPSEQSTRLASIILSANRGDTEAAKILAPFGLDFSACERVVRISVTLDDFSALSTAERELKEANWIPSELALAPTLNLADFQTTIEILASQGFFLHYFTERERIQKTMLIFADEIDFLGCYLDTGFNVGELEEKGYSMVLTGMSEPVDHYYNSLDAGIKLEKPKPKLSPYFSKLIRAIELKRFARWTTISIDLLQCASYREQKNIDRLLIELKRKVEKKWRDPQHECSLAVIPPKARETNIIFFAYPPKLAARKKEIAEGLAMQALEDGNRQKCVVICRNVDHWDNPYSSVLIFDTKGRKFEQTQDTI